MRRPTAGGGETHPSFHPSPSCWAIFWFWANASSTFFDLSLSFGGIFDLLIQRSLYDSCNISGIFSTKALISSRTRR